MSPHKSDSPKSTDDGKRMVDPRLIDPDAPVSVPVDDNPREASTEESTAEDSSDEQQQSENQEAQQPSPGIIDPRLRPDDPTGIGP